MSKLFSALFLPAFTALFSLMAPHALAQQTFQNWNVECPTADDGSTTCIVFGGRQTQEGRELTRLMAIFPANATEGILHIRTPLGTNLKSGLVLKVGTEGREVPLSFTVCGPEGCIATVGLSQHNLTRLRTADQIEVRFVYGEPVFLPIPTAGLDDALKSIQR